MRRLLLACGLAFLASPAFAIDGIYKTEPGETGGHLLVQIAPCASNVCGTIVKAIRSDGTENKGYEHLGKPIIWGMQPDGANKWSGGKIWAPDQDKTYSSKMELQGNDLKVSGCVAAILCRSQIWVKQ